MENRRDFLRLSAAGVVAAVPMAARAADMVAKDLGGQDAAAVDGQVPGATDVGSEPEGVTNALFAPLSAGSDLGLGWRFARAFAPREGAVTVNLVHTDGRAARVDVCLLQGKGRGPAQSGLCDFIVMDGGDGAAPMDEPLGRALACLAAVVRQNELADASQALLALEPHQERVWKHPAAMAVAARRLTPGTSETL